MKYDFRFAVLGTPTWQTKSNDTAGFGQNWLRLIGHICACVCFSSFFRKEHTRRAKRVAQQMNLISAPVFSALILQVRTNRFHFYFRTESATTVAFFFFDSIVFYFAFFELKKRWKTLVYCSLKIEKLFFSDYTSGEKIVCVTLVARRLPLISMILHSNS